MVEQSSSSFNQKSSRLYQTLLEDSETISKNRDRHSLIGNLTQFLPQIVHFDFVGLFLPDIVIQTQKPILVFIVMQNNRYPGFFNCMHGYGANAFYALPYDHFLS